MTEPVFKQIVLASRPNGLPTREHFRLEEVPMPEPPQGGLLLRVLYLSLDPYMRGRMDDRKSYAKPVGIGEVMTGESVCEVIASSQAGYAVGDIVLAPTGWRTHATSAGEALRKLDPAVAPLTTGLGVLGMPGFTAYAGLKPHRQTEAGRNGCCGGCKWTCRLTRRATRQAGRRESGRNRRWSGKMPRCHRRISLRCRCRPSHTPDFAEKLAAACPNGIDVYFENVGGAVWQAVLPLLNKFARVRQRRAALSRGPFSHHDERCPQRGIGIQRVRSVGHVGEPGLPCSQ